MVKKIRKSANFFLLLYFIFVAGVSRLGLAVVGRLEPAEEQF